MCSRRGTEDARDSSWQGRDVGLLDVALRARTERPLLVGFKGVAGEEDDRCLVLVRDRLRDELLEADAPR